MTRVMWIGRPSGRHLLSGTALAALFALALPTLASAECRADGDNYPGDCTHHNYGSVVDRPLPANTREEPAPPLGDLGFSISIDRPDASEGAPRRTIAGAPARPERARQTDRRLDMAGVDLTYDGLGARPRLAIATKDLRRSFAPGERVTFRASSNYPGWIHRAEVIVRDERGHTIARVPISPNGTAEWAMPADGPDHLLYFLRAEDRTGHRDETRALTLARSAGPMAPDLDGPVTAAGEGDDMIARRGIPIRGGAITVSGQARDGNSVRVLGEAVPTDPSGRFVVQRILPPGTHDVPVLVDGQRMDRTVTIEQSEWFATGIVDLTIGHHHAGETWKSGRIAGFGQGTLADGTRITGSVDTREQELRDLFRRFGRKFPDQTLRSMEAQDVFNTLGDDSHASELAPTSGRAYLRVEKDGSHLTWGDFRPVELPDRMIRSDRTLYGLEGEYRSTDITATGEPRFRISGFAAQADSLAQRDVLRATGGSAYFLSRQDILANTETIFVEVRSRATGLVVERTRLVEGTDYRINPVQGVVILNAPLTSSMRGDGLVSDNPLGDYDVNLVAQYEYIPTTGTIDGYSAGLRAEGWVSDHLRFGASAQRETTGIADTDLLGVDILLRDGEERELSIEYATSEGPGFGTAFSLDGGFEIEAINPSYGLRGHRAGAWRIAGRTDLAPLGLDGEIAAFYDRKEEGFSSPDDDIRYGQRAWGLSGEVALGADTDLTFGAEVLRRDDGRREEDARIGLRHRYSDQWMIEGEIAHDRKEELGSPRDFGTRTDAAVRLTWTRDDDLSIWGLAQGTLAHDDARRRNDRLGVGTFVRLNESTDLTAEVSGGNLGTAGRLEFGYRPDENTQTTIGYRLDPLRRFDVADFAGHDRGSLVTTVTSRVNDRWAVTSESTYSAFGTRPSLTSGYGVTYTPDQRWRINGMLQDGKSTESDGTTLRRRGLSLGTEYSAGEDMTAGMRGEIQSQRSTRPGGELDRDTYLVSGHYETKVNPDWRFVSSLDAVFSNSNQESFRDGRYVEARLGYAWRPVDNDRVNAFLSYTYLYDMPGVDQVNRDGDIEGPRQRSHIINAALSYQIDPAWTLGAKYGYRLRESETSRNSHDFASSEAHLGVLRLDYHVVHNWDIMGEVRTLRSTRTSITENAALIGVYRLVGNNLRVGGGYLWGEVSDDLRRIKAPDRGVFLNITSQF